MEKIVAMIIMLLFLFPFISSENTVHVANTNNVLYVGGTGPNNYTKIQDAINDAKDGYIIYVYPGYYNESIVINRSISLIGVGEEKPVIDGKGNEYTVLIEADNCTVKRFVIKHGEIGIEINGSHTLLENNVIEFSGIGIEIYASNNKIKNNTVRKCVGIGIYVESSNNSIINNTVANNKATGIFIFGHNARFNTISYNNVTRNFHGMEIDFTKNCTISFNHVYKNKQYGISIDICENMSILNNSIHDHTYGGLQLMDCSYSIVEGNEIYENSAGIMVQSSYTWGEHFNLIKRNDVYSNADYGIYVERSLYNVFTQNNLINNGRNAWFWYHVIIGNPSLPIRPCHNRWFNNYWDDWKSTLPKPVVGLLDVDVDLFDRYICIWSGSWLNFDWHPALEPWK